MFENVNKELLEKAMQAKTKDEALAILREGGVELTDEDLQSVSAGGEEDEGICWKHKTCWELKTCWEHRVCPINEPDKCIEHNYCPDYDPDCPFFGT